MKSKGVQLGLKIATRHLTTTEVNGLQCLFCIIFGREGRSGSKRKTYSAVKAWEAPFRYDNIDHMRNQHTVQFEEYEVIYEQNKGECVFLSAVVQL